MLSYQHTYHAGCFADVMKHLTLTHVLDYMVKKDKPLLYLDTHSGRGFYDLFDPHALKTQEATMGIKRLWDLRQKLPKEFSHYIDIIASHNSDGQLRYYPGSPLFAINLLRPTDRLCLSELHPGEFESLHDKMRHYPRVHCSHNDGYTQLHALLPPKERRALILIDPSYEVKTEYKHMTQAVTAAYRQFATGVYCIWYPLVDNKLHQQIIRGFESMAADKSLRAEFYLNPDYQESLRGYGMWIINPPFTLSGHLKVIFETLRQLFYPKASYLIE